MPKTMDPLRLDIIKNALIAVTEEMSATLYRSAYSTNIKTRKDYTCSLFDKQLRVIAQAFAQPAHLGVMFRTIPMAVSRYGVDNLREGDALIVNDPYCGAAHLNDVCIIEPIFNEGDIVGYAACMAHQVDIGGSAPGGLSLSQELYQEGIIIPPIKILLQGQINNDVFELIKRNIRSKEEVPGDLKAQIAANRTGRIRFLELIKQYSVETLSEYTHAILEYTEQRTWNEFNQLPTGEFTGVDYLDNDGFSDIPIKIQVKISIDNNNVFFDFEGTDQQRRSPMNCPLGWTYSAVSFVLKCLISNDIPLNDGFYRCIKINAPHGTVLNPKEPAGVVGGSEVGMRAIGAMFKALSNGMPEKIPAASKGTVNQLGFGAFDPVKQRYHTYYEAIGGGFGGRQGKDGMNAVQTDFSNTENAPVEEIEIGYPVQIVRHELIPSSGGAGEYRGGLGIRRDFKFPYGPATFTILCDRVKFPPWGIQGGKDAYAAEYILNPDTENEQVLPSKGTFEVSKDDIVSVRTPGGGGYGHPFLRDSEKVRVDVEQGMIHTKQSLDDYGVCILPNGTVDIDKTAKIRKSRSEEKGVTLPSSYEQVI